MNRKNNKKGFTLVEVIVVLVILAILAAIMIPAMTGWIDKARDKAIIVEARTAYLAAQTLATEDYGVSTAVTARSDSALSLAGLSGATFNYTLSGAVVNSCSYTSTKSGSKTANWSLTTGTWTVD